MRSHDDLKALVPILALDALGETEEAELLDHLKVCRECSDLLAQHRETAGMLALTAGSRPAPADLRERILGAAARTPQIRQAPAPVQLRPAAERPVRRLWAGLAAAAVLVLLAGGLTIQRIANQDSRLTEQQTIIARQRAALDLISNPDAIVLAMGPQDGAGGHGRVFVSREDGSAAVVVAGLNPLAGDEIYTLWLIDEGDPQAVTDFVPEDGVAVLPVEGPVDAGATLAVTHEPNPGNTSPQGPVITASIRA